MRFRRRLYSRGGSHETTIPKPLLFALDPSKRHDVLFEYDSEKKEWKLSFEEREEKKLQPKRQKRRGDRT
jgi:hypothetical protein